jgi:hypothetical protein
VFLGYSNMHKCFKCLNASTCRIYISRDVVFDENIFPFSKLHHNVGARLCSEILLLPSSVVPSKHLSGGVNNLNKPDANSSNPVNENRGLFDCVQIADQSGAVVQIADSSSAAPRAEPEAERVLSPPVSGMDTLPQADSPSCGVSPPASGATTLLESSGIWSNYASWNRSYAG